jgi:nitrous oxide reductase
MAKSKRKDDDYNPSDSDPNHDAIDSATDIDSDNDHAIQPSSSIVKSKMSTPSKSSKENLVARIRSLVSPKQDRNGKNKATDDEREPNKQPSNLARGIKLREYQVHSKDLCLAWAWRT